MIGESVMTAYSGNAGFLILYRHRQPSFNWFVKSTTKGRNKIVQIDFLEFEPDKDTESKA